MNCVNRIKSNKDNTIKYIFALQDNTIIELSYIDKNDGKDIICVPSQTSCILSCKFCHITDIKDKIKHRNLTSEEIQNSVDYVINDNKLYNKVLLISFMGCGEPIINYKNIISSMTYIRDSYKSFPFVRFAIATSIPEFLWVNFYKLTNGISKNNLHVKIHLSLHYTMDSLRKEWMPYSLPIIPSISALDFFQKITKNSVELHYTLIENINDTEQDAILLRELLKDKDIPVKFLFFNKKDSLLNSPSQKNKLNLFKKHFDKYNIRSEYYIPPGLDIGASCGQFLLDYYLKYKKGVI